MPNQRRQYTEEEFKEAIAAIRDGSMSIRRAAHVYTLPKSIERAQIAYNKALTVRDTKLLSGKLKDSDTTLVHSKKRKVDEFNTELGVKSKFRNPAKSAATRTTAISSPRRCASAS